MEKVFFCKSFYFSVSFFERYCCSILICQHPLLMDGVHNHLKGEASTSTNSTSIC